MAKNDSKSGGKNLYPRSLGLTFFAIRQELGLTQGEMLEHLKLVKSKFSANDLPKAFQGIGNFENVDGNPNFSVLHRYAKAACTETPILYLVAFTYSRLLEAKESQDSEKKKEYLTKLEEMLDGHERVIEQAKEELELCRDNDCDWHEGMEGNPHINKTKAIKVRHSEIINRMIKRYYLPE